MKFKIMNKEQKKIVNDFIDKYGGVEIIENKRKVVLKLDDNMIKMEGLSLNWLNKLNKCFYEITVGLSDFVYISMFKIE